MNNVIKFAKLNPEVKIPSKRNEDGGYDLYASPLCNDILIKKGDVAMIPTGLMSAFSSDYVVLLEERGSTGVRCMARRAGVIDSGYRGEWHVPINNTGNRDILITSRVKEISVVNNVMSYPASKAIAQFLVIPVPKMEIVEINIGELELIESERGSGKLGSSDK
jgi:dUTP pyrophosphatase